MHVIFTNGLKILGFQFSDVYRFHPVYNRELKFPVIHQRKQKQAPVHLITDIFEHTLYHAFPLNFYLPIP
jgi:hypothetical protein